MALYSIMTRRRMQNIGDIRVALFLAKYFIRWTVIHQLLKAIQPVEKV